MDETLRSVIVSKRTHEAHNMVSFELVGGPFLSRDPGFQNLDVLGLFFDELLRHRFNFMRFGFGDDSPIKLVAALFAL